MADPFAAGLTVLRGVFARPVVYTGAGLASATILAIETIEPADPLGGFNAKGRRRGFEIALELLPEEPRKTDTITQGGIVWKVDDINLRDDVGAYVLFVKR